MKRLLILLSMIFINPLAYQINYKQKRNNLNDYESNVDNCIASLKNDITFFPYQELDWTIYTPTIYISDPSGFQQKGILRYKQVFSLIRLFCKLMIDNVEITYKLKYIPESKLIMIIWYSKWYNNNQEHPFSLDAISKFYLDDKGLIDKHQIEKMYSNADIQIIQKLAHLLDMFYNHDNYPEYAFIQEECQYIWDCDAPMDCCDFILFKSCCSNGIKPPPKEPILIPLLIPTEDKAKILY
tara:strand:- start:11517 stop:12236 length:720 start_codon:yes stop_codon:yes gene_type:complete